MEHEYIDMGKPAFRRNQLENDLRRQIKMRTGDFDEPLATEQKLSATYQLSRNTIRKVLQKLQNEGLLIRKTGFGTFIVPLPVTLNSTSPAVPSTVVVRNLQSG